MSQNEAIERAAKLELKLKDSSQQLADLKARNEHLKGKLTDLAVAHRQVGVKHARIEELEQDLKLASVTVRMWIDKFHADRKELDKLVKLWREAPVPHRDAMALCAAELQAWLEKTDVPWPPDV